MTSPTPSTQQSPDRMFPTLFEAAQNSDIYPDSKTFVDAIPKSDPRDLESLYQQARKSPDFSLEEFIDTHFDLPLERHPAPEKNLNRQVTQHIDKLWDLLTRSTGNEPPYSSLIGLPRPFVVPGGRFREIYYWDSYFTLLGLSASGRHQLVEDMVIDFAHLIDEIGFVPNGNRTYYCSRSQPPFFALMVDLLASTRNDEGVYQRFLPQLQKEYEFWMAGSEHLTDNGSAWRRVIAVDGGYLNRYWDDEDSPRPESFHEDRMLAGQSTRSASGLYRDIRAACESGWDFSSRWLENEHSLASIRTTRIVPIDLNALMYHLESVLSKSHGLAGDDHNATTFEQRRQMRGQLIRSRCYNPSSGAFTDLLLPDLTQLHRVTLATTLPLFFNIATQDQAQGVNSLLQSLFLRPGGWVTSPVHSGQQWDTPNGWAPSQWMTYRGLLNYGFTAEAIEGAGRWVDNNLKVYRDTGRLMEKYDVETPGLLAQGGEYDVQDGFGWTNGVLLCLLQELKNQYPDS